MLKGKNLWVALGVGAVAYYLWMQNKKKQALAAAPSTAPANFTGDLDVPAYQNAYGTPRFGRAGYGYPSSQNRLGNKLTFGY
jgi:hypothetical protein